MSRLVDLRIACTEFEAYPQRDEHGSERIRDVRLAAMGTVKMLERQFYLSSAGVRWVHRIRLLLLSGVVGIFSGRREIGFSPTMRLREERAERQFLKLSRDRADAPVPGR